MPGTSPVLSHLLLPCDLLHAAPCLVASSSGGFKLKWRNAILIPGIDPVSQDTSSVSWSSVTFSTNEVPWRQGVYPFCFLLWRQCLEQHSSCGECSVNPLGCGRNICLMTECLLWAEGSAQVKAPECQERLRSGEWGGQTGVRTQRSGDRDRGDLWRKEGPASREASTHWKSWRGDCPWGLLPRWSWMSAEQWNLSLVEFTPPFWKSFLKGWSPSSLLEADFWSRLLLRAVSCYLAFSVIKAWGRKAF